MAQHQPPKSSLGRRFLATTFKFAVVLLAVLTVISAMFSIVALSHGLWFYSAYAGVITCFGITALRLALAYLIR